MDLVVLALSKNYTNKKIKEITNVGLGEPESSAKKLEENESPTVDVSLSGPDSDKVFSFDFGIPQGPTGDKPELGVDYWTEEQKNELIANANNKILEKSYSKEEMKNKYLPIEWAIKLSNTSTGICSLNPTVQCGMQGLKLYGRSWQDGTPSVETEVPIQSAGDSGTVNVRVNDGGIQTKQLLIPTPDGLAGIPVNSGGTWTDENGQQWVSDVVDLDAGTLTQYCGQIASYAGEEITTPYISSTGALTTGAQVVYVLPEPVATPFDAETIADYKALTTYQGTTNVLAPDCGIEASAIANGTKYIEQQTQKIITNTVLLSS